MWITVVYLVGVAIGLVAIDGGPATRIGLAIAWPLGPLAFLVTVAGLLVVAAIAFPIFGAALVAAIGAAWWLLH
jgi:hypothetical protein